MSSPAIPWQQFQTVEILQLHLLRFDLHRLLSRIPVNQTIVSSLLILPCRTELTQPDCSNCLPYNLSAGIKYKKNVSSSNSIVVCIFVAMGTYLTIHCLEMAVVYSPISQSLHSNNCKWCNMVPTSSYQWKTNSDIQTSSSSHAAKYKVLLTLVLRISTDLTTWSYCNNGY